MEARWRLRGGSTLNPWIGWKPDPRQITGGNLYGAPVRPKFGGGGFLVARPGYRPKQESFAGLLGERKFCFGHVMEKEIKLPKNLTHLMRQRYLTLSRLGNELGINKSTLHGYKNGSFPRGLQSLLKIAKYFELTIDELVYANLDSEKPTPIKFGQPQIPEANSELLEPTDNLDCQLFELHHQLRSIGEVLKTLDYKLVDGVHLPGFGISLCQIAEKVKMIESRVAREN